MKKMIALLMALLMCFTACSAGAGTSASMPADSSSASASSTSETTETELEPATISVWFNGNEGDPGDRDIAWMNLALDKFKEEYPQITVESTLVGGAGGADYRTKLAAEIASGNTPDVFMTWVSLEMEPFVRKGAIISLEEMINNDPDLSRMVDRSKQVQSTFDGQIYALSMSNDPIGLFYNKAIFEQYNVTPPETIDELLEVSKVFLENDITPIAFGNSVVWLTALPYAILYAENVGYDAYMKQYEDKVMDYTCQESKDALKTLRSLVEAGVFTKDYDGIQPAESMAVFTDEKAAMFLQGGWNAANLNAALGEKVGYIAFPTVEKMGLNLESSGKGFAVSSTCETPAVAAAAEAFYKTLYSEEVMRELTKLGVVTNFKIDLTGIEMNPLQADLAQQIADGRYKSIMQIENFTPASVQNEIRNTVQAVAAGNVGIDEAMESLQSYIDQME